MVSREKRKLISKARKNGMRVKDMSEVYEVPERTIRGLLQYEQKHGSMEPLTGNCGRNPALSEQQKEQMRQIIEGQPDITLNEIKERMHLSICISAISRIITEKLGMSYKKKRLEPAKGKKRKTARNEKRSRNGRKRCQPNA